MPTITGAELVGIAFDEITFVDRYRFRRFRKRAAVAVGIYGGDADLVGSSIYGADIEVRLGDSGCRLDVDDSVTGPISTIIAWGGGVILLSVAHLPVANIIDIFTGGARVYLGADSQAAIKRGKLRAERFWRCRSVDA